MTGPRRTYDDAQRAAFLREASLPGSAIHTIARAHGISSGTAYRWLHEARDADPPPGAVAVLLCSDWHIGALVEAAEMHGRPHILSNGCLTGYNEYAREGGLRPTLPAQWLFGLDTNGLAWSHNIVLGAWPETYADERTGVLRGTLSEAEAEA